MSDASEIERSLNDYAKTKGVNAQAKVALDGSIIGLFVPPGKLEFESPRVEDIAVHIDIMAMAAVKP